MAVVYHGSGTFRDLTDTPALSGNAGKIVKVNSTADGVIYETGGGGSEVVSGVFNESGNDVDFRVEGDTDVNLFVTDASTDRVGVKTATPVTDLDINGTVVARTGRAYSTTDRNIPVTYGCEGDVVFSIDPNMNNDQLAAFCGLTTSQVQWETGADGADSPGGATLKFSGLNINIGGHFNDCGFPQIPIEDAFTSAGVPGRSEGDLSATYYAEMWVKSNNATSRVYSGSTDYEHDFTQVPHEVAAATTHYGNPGSYAYWAVSPSGADATTPGTTWTKASGYISGFHDDNSGAFESDAAYFSPMALINWGATSDSSSVMWISGWKIWKVSGVGNRILDGVMIFKEVTAPTGEADTAKIYAANDGGTGEMYVCDGANNHTKISPHNADDEWEYYSKNRTTGKIVRINMERMVRKLEEVTGETFIEDE